MTYLYGDSTPSPLQINFIEFLRDALDACVHMLLADQKLRENRERASGQEKSAAAEMARLESLLQVVNRALEGARPAEGQSATAQCALQIGSAAQELTARTVSTVKQTLGQDLSVLAGHNARERESCVKALEALVLKHDLPSATSGVHVRAAGGRYQALLVGRTTFGLTTSVELDVPAAHLFAHPLRLDRLSDRLEVQAPEAGTRAGGKLKAQRLEKLHLAELLVEATEMVLRLRATPEGGAGFDLVVRPEAPRVRLQRIGDQGENVGEVFDVGDPDAQRLYPVHDKLAVACAELFAHRRALVDAQFEGKPLKDQDEPTLVVQRLIETITPVVQQIARRSLSPTELVLKRLLSDTRREEIFIAKADLFQKLTGLSETQRALFEPLALDDGVPTRVDPMSGRRPAPAAAPAKPAADDLDVSGSDDLLELPDPSELTPVAKLTPPPVISSAPPPLRPAGPTPALPLRERKPTMPPTPAARPPAKPE